MKWRSLPESQAVEVSSLRELFAERKALMARYLPPEVQAVHARVVQELKQAARRELQPGMIAPGFALPDQRGEMVRSSERLASGRLVICFFRGRWCPFCVGQLEAMNAVSREIGRWAASLVAISPQTVHQSSLMADQHRLRFPLLSDAGNGVARQFGLVYCVPDDQQQIYRRAFINLPFVNGEPAWELPIPATYILNRDHRIIYAASNPDYSERPEPGELLGVLARLVREGGGSSDE
jgi:peroxiredoxin